MRVEWRQQGTHKAHAWVYFPEDTSDYSFRLCRTRIVDTTSGETLVVDRIDADRIGCKYCHQRLRHLERNLTYLKARRIQRCT